MVTLLVRPDIGHRAYRLRCRFRVGAYPTQDWLDKAKYTAAEQFVADLAKQGWTYLDKHGFKMSGPFVPVEIVNLPTRHQQAQWHMKSSEMLNKLGTGQQFRAASASYASIVPPVAECEYWEFELAGVFVHQTLLTERPDAHEEKKGLATR